MKVKLCPKCKSNSYSSYEKGTWICPNCGKDITHIKAGEPYETVQS